VAQCMLLQGQRVTETGAAGGEPTGPAAGGSVVGTGSAADQLTGVLRRQILEGRIPPDAPLREVALAESFGVSRNTVRAAIHGLVHEGLARHERNRGALVVRLVEEDAHDLYAARRLLEVSAADRLPVALESQIATVGAAYDDLADAVASGQWTKVVVADVAFHRSIVGLHHSPRLLRMFKTMESELAYFMSLIRLREQEEERPEHILAEHRAVQQAITDRAPRAARAAIAGHLAYYEERASRLLDDHPE
jgi:DNA-binding GntR family transcriptional regulator